MHGVHGLHGLHGHAPHVCCRGGGPLPLPLPLAPMLVAASAATATARPRWLHRLTPAAASRRAHAGASSSPGQRPARRRGWDAPRGSVTAEAGSHDGRVAPHHGSYPRVCVADGHGMVYAAYHALGRSGLTAPGPGGKVSGALHGFCLKLSALLSGTAPGLGGAFDRVVVVFDGRRDGGGTLPHSRESLTAHLPPERRYKASRPPFPNDLKEQMEASKAACTALGVPWASSPPGYEADDLIAALCAPSPGRLAASAHVTVVSHDKDLCQVVRDSHPSVCIAHSVRGGGGGGGYVVLREADFPSAKIPVRPRSLGDFLALVGDPSDGVAGVKGIGKVKAVQALNAADAHFRALDGDGAEPRPFADVLAPDAHGNLVHLDALAEDLPKSLIASLRDREQQEAFRLARDLVALRADTCPVPPELDAKAVLAPTGPGDRHAAHAFLAEWGLHSVRDKLLAAHYLSPE